MVQMKVLKSLISQGVLVVFISHMVQMKEASEAQAEAQEAALYPTWFR